MVEPQKHNSSQVTERVDPAIQKDALQAKIAELTERDPSNSSAERLVEYARELLQRELLGSDYVPAEEIGARVSAILETRDGEQALKLLAQSENFSEDKRQHVALNFSVYFEGEVRDAALALLPEEMAGKAKLLGLNRDKEEIQRQGFKLFEESLALDRKDLALWKKHSARPVRSLLSADMWKERFRLRNKRREIKKQNDALSAKLETNEERKNELEAANGSQ